MDRHALAEGLIASFPEMPPQLPARASRVARSRDRLATGGKEAGRCGGVDVGDQQSFLAIWLVAKQCPVRMDQRCGGRRARARTINRCEIAGILGGAAQCGLLVE